MFDRLASLFFSVHFPRESDVAADFVRSFGIVDLASRFLGAAHTWPVEIAWHSEETAIVHWKVGVGLRATLETSARSSDCFRCARYLYLAARVCLLGSSGGIW